METRLLQLRKKYIDKNAEGQKHGDINVVLRDVADSTEKRDTEIARAQQRFSDEISHHKTQVSEARKLREEADRKIEEGKQHIKEMQKHDDDMAAAQDAAQEAVNTQFPLLEAEAQNTVESANQIFLNEKTRVDAILASDTS